MWGRVRAVIIGVVCVAGMENSSVHGKRTDDTALAEWFTELLKAGQTVVSKNQSLINDGSKGEKGFADKFLGSLVLDKFNIKTQIDLFHPLGA